MNREHPMRYKIRRCSLITIVVFSSCWVTGCSLLPYDPPAYMRARVVFSDETITKSLFFQDARIGDVTDVRVGDLDPAPGDELVAVGIYGAAVVSRDGSLIRYIPLFDRKYRRSTRIVLFPDNQRWAFLSFGVPVGGALLTDSAGQQQTWLHRHGARSASVNDVAWSDLDGDGQLEFLLATGHGVRLMDEQGNLIWKSLDWVRRVDTADIDNDGLQEILASEHGDLVVLDRKGNTLRRTHLSRHKPDPSYFSDFDIVHYPARNDPEHIMVTHLGGITLLATDAVTTRAKLESDWLSDALGLPVQLKPGAKHFAVSGRIMDQGGLMIGFRLVRGVLHIFDTQDGRLVYHEVLDGSGQGITTSAEPVDGRQSLFVGGGDGKVWVYRAK